MSEYFTHTDWLNSRLGRFTASEIHKLFTGGRKKDELFGDVAKTYIRLKVAEEITQQCKDQTDFKQTEWGYANEFEACQLFEKQMGFNGTYYGVANPKFFEYGEHGGGSPDWENETDGADFKAPYCSDEHIKNLILTSEADLKADRFNYYCQAQMNMLIRGWKRFHFVSYDPRMPDALKLKIITVLPDMEWQSEFKIRLEKAIEKKQEIIDKLMSIPQVIIAEPDQVNGQPLIVASLG